jgi:hypothetical protein
MRGALALLVGFESSPADLAEPVPNHAFPGRDYLADRYHPNAGKSVKVHSSFRLS